MNNQKLQYLLKKKEGVKLDFKEELKLDTESEKKEFVKDICAIANSRGGRGHIIFGIQDKTKKVVGVNLGPFDEERIQQIICNRCDPPVPIRVETLLHEEKMIAIITVFRSDQRPHQVRQTGTFYIRRGSTTDVARRHEIANMLQENGLASYETILYRKAPVEALDQNLLQEYLGISSETHPHVKKDILLDGLGIIGKEYDEDIYYPTIGGLLLFCKEPQMYLPYSGIKIDQPFHSYYIKGNILEMQKETEDKIKEIFRETTYPIEAIFEAVANALVHRDYWDHEREIVISINKNQVQITNPGALWTSSGIYSIVKEQNPPRRNNWLYQRLLMIDHSERFLKSGLGIKRMQKAFEGKGKVKVINVPSKNIFKVIFPGIQEYSTSMNK